MYSYTALIEPSSIIRSQAIRNHKVKLAAKVATMLFTATLLLLSHCAAAQATDKIGIVDSSGKEIVPCQFADAKYLGRGLFFLREFQSADSAVPATRGRIYDHDGRQLPLSLPSLCSVEEVFLPAAFDKTSGIVQELPADAVLKIHGPKGFGLCRPSGAVIVEPKYIRIESLGEGFFAVSDANKVYRLSLSFVLNSKTGARVKGLPNSNLDTWCIGEVNSFSQDQSGKSRRLSGYMSRGGTVLIAPQFCEVREFSTDGLAAVTFHKRIGWYYIDRKGKVVSRPFRLAGDFQDGFAIVGVGSSPEVPFGLINNRFKFTVPPIYYNLERVCPNIYAARRNRDGQFIAINAAGNVLFKFLPEVDNVVGIKNGLIECRGVLPGTSERGTMLIARNGKIVSTEKGFKSILNKPAIESVSSDRMIKRVQNDHFDPESFKQSLYGHARILALADFLHCYDVIGMTRKQIQTLLGESGDDYVLTKSVLCNSEDGMHLRFEYSDEKVSGWRMIIEPTSAIGDNGLQGPWIRTNMEFDWPDYHILEFPGFRLRSKTGKP